jgi:hypothetical protein
MNLAMDTALALPDPGLPGRRPLARLVAGIALSVAMHALLLSLTRPPPAAIAPPPVPLTVRLQPPAPAVPAEQPAQAEPALPPPRRQAAPPRQAPRPARAARPVIAVPPAGAFTEDSLSVAPAPVTPAQDGPASPPSFDMDAARKVARATANAPDPARIGTALERLPPPPLQTESKFERAIKAAKRPSCKDGVPGGLLAPLFLMMDKKDSGCKW